MLNFELVAERFSGLRNRSGLTQSIMAEYLNVDQNFISKFEKGERQFSEGILEKVAELFGCSVEYFVNESIEFTQMPLALRTKNITIEDLNAIAAMNKIALNLKFMEGLLERE